MKTSLIAIIALYVATSLISCQITLDSSMTTTTIKKNKNRKDTKQQSSGMQSFSTSIENFADTLASLTEDSIIVLTGEVTEENIKTIRKIIDHSRNDIYLDLSKTTGLLRIPSRAFEVCPNLLGINIPSSVTSIGERAFKGSTISQVIIPSSVTSIGDNAFSKCFELTQISIPNSVTSIGEGAFYNCESLKQISIPESITSIGDCAFAECEKLTQISIPNSVTFIGGEAFHWCTNLTSVEFEQTANWYTTDDEDNFQNKTGGTPIDVTNTTTNAMNLKSTYLGYFWYRTDN